MPAPTITDVLAALARLDAKVDAHRGETETSFTDVRADIDAHRRATAEGFAVIEKELAGHSDPVHATLEADIRALHRPLVRAKIPGIPTDLPSEVRAKAGKPAAKRRRR